MATATIFFNVLPITFFLGFYCQRQLHRMLVYTVWKLPDGPRASAHPGPSLGFTTKRDVSVNSGPSNK